MPILNQHAFEFISRSPEQTRRLGIRLGALLNHGDLVCLNGDLGSGKTTLVQGMARGWGSGDEVSSPTFVLVNLYRRRDGSQLYHLDAYRLSGAAEAVDLDLDALLAGGALVVEWAERIRAALPGEALVIQMKYVDDNQRDLVITATGERYEAILNKLRRLIFGVK